MAAKRQTAASLVQASPGNRAGSHTGPPRPPEIFPVIGLGASAGGLDACRKLLAALPAKTGMAFILVQHLDPTHVSMMVDLLGGHAALAIVQAAEGMPIAPDHLYVIPPGAYLSVGNGALHLSRPLARHGARLAFDFLLHSLAEEYGPRAIALVLSGTGADGSLGLRSIKERCGLVIAQDPKEAGYDGMPRSAIGTGAVDLVLPVEKIPAALVKYDRRMTITRRHNEARPDRAAQDWLPEILELLRTSAAYDFRLYKPGTLQRRIERRMAMAAIDSDDMDRYLDLLRGDQTELDLLAKDLFINVTSFFRDPKVFDLLREKVVPDLVRAHATDHPLRIWIAGCSSGEETYSLAMLFHEQMAAEKRNIRLQVFASDVDPDAVATAREGLYPEAIEADVSAARLARYFTKEGDSYRIVPELRATVVFTVQDVLADPPFSRLDLISCRNLLIYLQPEAQAKVISLFHFALRDGGILLLGSSESIGNIEGRFEAVSKSARIFRHIGRSRPGELLFSMNAGAGARLPGRQEPTQTGARQAPLAELCRRLVMEAYAPAAVLVNRRHECLYSLGPTDRYLRVSSGMPTQDILVMARDGVRTKLRAAIQRAIQDNARVVIGGGRTGRKGDATRHAFSIAAQPVPYEGEDFLLVSFIDEPARDHRRGQPLSPQDISRVAELEQELEATRMELQGAIHNLEISSDEQKAINEEALSVNEEFQSTNEELLTSKEELQSLNEELTALNSQLQETLERQRTTSNDLQNVLYSTDVATIFLDTGLKIRLFTPATRSLFKVIPGDIGRPLADLSSLTFDGTLLSDARKVLETLAPAEGEIETQSGSWYVRRILPYRTQDNGVEGVVITFYDNTARKRTEEALEVARRQAELANLAKTRFLAAASHDLRQPLQTIALVQGLLAKIVEGAHAKMLVARIDETVSTMTGMLNSLLDITRIETGTIQPELADFPINGLLGPLKEEFSYHAQAKGLVLRVVPCGLSVRSDPRLLEQAIRNLLSNALKYTAQGKVLLGCRRHDGMLSIAVWDTGIGIAEEELQAIFEEYHQVDNAVGEQSRGLGLGLAIVRQVARLLGHHTRVRSTPGKGSVFTVEVPLAQEGAGHPREANPSRVDHPPGESVQRTGAILIVEDDSAVRELLSRFLNDEGFTTTTTSDLDTALRAVAQGGFRPDLILTDFNLQNGMNGIGVMAKLREQLQLNIPVIVLTGEISSGTLKEIALHGCVHLNKPVKLAALTRVIQRLLATPPAPLRARPAADPPAAISARPVIFVVDDENSIRAAIRSLLEEEGRTILDYGTCEEFLEAYRPGQDGCLLVDASLPGMSGLELLQRLNQAGDHLPAIMITGNGDVPTAVRAMKAGAVDFIEKPVSAAELLASVARALKQSRGAAALSAWRAEAADHIASLTPRQREIMDLVLAGHPSKNIAADLGISQRTVENHRAAIMKKTGAKSLPALARLALAAVSRGTDDPPERR